MEMPISKKVEKSAENSASINTLRLPSQSEEFHIDFLSHLPKHKLKICSRF